MWRRVFAGGVVFGVDIEPPHDGLRGRPLRCLRRTLRTRGCATFCGMGQPYVPAGTPRHALRGFRTGSGLGGRGSVKRVSGPQHRVQY